MPNIEKCTNSSRDLRTGEYEGLLDHQYAKWRSIKFLCSITHSGPPLRGMWRWFGNFNQFVQIWGSHRESWHENAAVIMRWLLPIRSQIYHSNNYTNNCRRMGSNGQGNLISWLWRSSLSVMYLIIIRIVDPDHEGKYIIAIISLSDPLTSLEVVSEWDFQRKITSSTFSTVSRC